MLVLSRKLGESLRIGNDVEVTVLAVSGDRIRLGIQAPRSVPVLRSELEKRETVDCGPRSERGCGAGVW